MTPVRPAQTRIRDWARRLAPLIVAVAVACFFILHGRPERLPDFPAGVLHDGWVYWTVDDGSTSAIHARPLTGGPERLVVRENPQVQIDSLRPGTFAITSSSIFYMVMPRPPKLRAGIGGSPGGTGSPVVFPGTFHPSPPKRTGHEKRIVRKVSVLFTFPERLHRVSLHGGTPQEAWKMHGISPTIAGDNLYWMAPRPDEQVILQDGNTFRYERSIGHSDLMTMPLTGGPARKLLSGLSTGIFLLAGTDGVCWTVPHAYPDRRVDLYRCRAADTRPLLIADYNGFPGNESVPVEFQGRLYWFGTRVDPNRQRTGYVQDCLMSANADGSDRRIMPSPIDRWRTAKSPLVPHRGYLYFAYEDTQRGRDPSYYLYRLSSGPAGKGEIVRKLPDLSYDPQFDGDYLYFTTAQRHKSLFDWLTDDDAHVKTTAAKYRLHLPD